MFHDHAAPHVPGQTLARSRFQHEGLAARTASNSELLLVGQIGLEPKVANTKKL